jgi:hypothetical protein
MLRQQESKIGGVVEIETWHFGLVARWWAEFNEGGPEIDFYARRSSAGSASAWAVIAASTWRHSDASIGPGKVLNQARTSAGSGPCGA